MTTLNQQDVISYAPELSSLSSALIEVYFDLAKNFVSEAKWERKYSQGVFLLTAHFLTLAQRRAGGAGPIASESVGELSISYGAVSDKSDELLTTTYGSMFYSLRKTLKITPLVV